MKNKLVLLTALVVFLAAGLVLIRDTISADDLQIRSEIVKDGTTSTIVNSTGDSETPNTDNSVLVTKNPTFKEVKDFILKDTTSRNQYVENKYECRHFATDVNNNADAVGIRCAFVLLCYRSGQHAVVGFDTTDKGMIYIEPQTDAAIGPIIGGFYQGQEIIEILISW
jgi:hypothetical protein